MAVWVCLQLLGLPVGIDSFWKEHDSTVARHLNHRYHHQLVGSILRILVRAMWVDMGQVVEWDFRVYGISIGFQMRSTPFEFLAPVGVDWDVDRIVYPIRQRLPIFVGNVARMDDPDLRLTLIGGIDEFEYLSSNKRIVSIDVDDNIISPAILLNTSIFIGEGPNIDLILHKYDARPQLGGI